MEDFKKNKLTLDNKNVGKVEYERTDKVKATDQKFIEARVNDMKEETGEKKSILRAGVGFFAGGLMGGGIGGSTGALIGGIVGSVVPGIGTAIGIAAGTGIGAAIGVAKGGGAGIAIGFAKGESDRKKDAKIKEDWGKKLYDNDETRKV